MSRLSGKELLWIAGGALVMAIGTNGFVLPNGLGQGGFAGLSIIAHRLTGIPLAAIYGAVNVPILTFGYLRLGRRFTERAVIGAALFTLALHVTRQVQFPMDDLLLATLYGGVVGGLGWGLMLRAGGTSGGMDILAWYLKRHHGISLTATYTVADAIILSAVALTLGTSTAFYALIITFVGGRVGEYLQEGIARAKAAIIISDRPEAIARVIMDDFSRGLTYLSGSGGYTSVERRVILVVVSIRELARLKVAIQDVDPRAFVIVTDVTEVMGEGFERRSL
ncbi:MAG TPA: YitT family protein [Clostridiales bacterium]|nr:YitT family protein [Clostridiales bacterium]